MIDLDKWAAVPLLPTAEMVRTAAKLVRANLPAYTGTLAIYSEMLAARPTDAPALIDPARLRELEADAARLDALQKIGAVAIRRDSDGWFVAQIRQGPVIWKDSFRAALDAALEQEQPR